jgi:phosphoribosylformylglycinamidine synthase
VWTGAIEEGAIVPIPIAHAEGRFVTTDTALLGDMERNGQIALRYCSVIGELDPAFPANPNGSMENIAGACNPAGNVLAMMPHPERATWLRQVPEDISGPWGRKRSRAIGSADMLDHEGPGRRFFASLLGCAGGTKPVGAGAEGEAGGKKEDHR